MIAILLGLRALSLLIWTAVLIRAAPGAWRAFHSHACKLDPFRALLFFGSFNRLWFVSRDLNFHASPESAPEIGILAASYVSAIAVGVGAYMLLGWYRHAD